MQLLIGLENSFAGREIGHTIFVGDRLKDTPIDNPVRRAYQLHRERAKVEHWNHHTADPTAVLLAVRGILNYWNLSECGYIDIKIIVVLCGRIIRKEINDISNKRWIVDDWDGFWRI